MTHCEKYSYVTKHEAKAAKKLCQQAAEAGATWRQESRIYRCSRCGSWHLTSLPHHEYDQEGTTG